MIGRTALNVRDKYKEIGGVYSDLRSKNKWTLKETLKLMKLVQRYSKTTILKDSINQLLDLEDVEAESDSRRISKTNPYFSPDKVMVSLRDPWTHRSNF
jgi:hypothetical protein